MPTIEQRAGIRRVASAALMPVPDRLRERYAAARLAAWLRALRLSVFCILATAGCRADTSVAEAAVQRRCSTSPLHEKAACFSPYFAALTREESAAAAMEKARVYQKSGRLNDCHFVAHVIGETNLEKQGFDVGKAFASCAFGCIEGCFHGVMEAYIGRQTDPQQFLAQLPGLCASIASDDVLYRQCIHGIGHGLIAHGFLPRDRAITACERLGGPFEQETCYGGLFMEYVARETLGGDAALTGKLAAICGDFQRGSLLRRYCVYSIGERMMFRTGYDYPKAFRFCLELGEDLSICLAGAREVSAAGGS